MTEKKKLDPRRLAPPPEIIKRMMERNSGKMPKNRFLRFCYLFFGDGV